MKKVADSQGRLDYRDVAVLAARNLAEEYFKLQQAYEEILAIVNEER
jgi:cell division protein ZapA (FtsZ GTPase activity inhibitor)